MVDEAKVIDLHSNCMVCKREIPEGSIYYKHPVHGIVCEYCPQFTDGGIEVDDD